MAGTPCGCPTAVPHLEGLGGAGGVASRLPRVWGALQQRYPRAGRRLARRQPAEAAECPLPGSGL